MTYTLLYAKDLQEGQRFSYRGAVFTAKKIDTFNKECLLCHQSSTRMIRVEIDGGSLEFFPTEAVEMHFDGSGTMPLTARQPDDTQDIGNVLLK